MQSNTRQYTNIQKTKYVLLIYREYTRMQIIQTIHKNTNIYTNYKKIQKQNIHEQKTIQ